MKELCNLYNIVSSPTPEIESLETRFKKLNDILGEGAPKGRLIEIYGASQVGKTLIALSLFNIPTLLFDVERKVPKSYLESLKLDNVLTDISNNEKLFDIAKEAIKLNIHIIIDSLPYVCDKFDSHKKRNAWLYDHFLRLQAETMKTKSVITIINGIRQAPSTGKMYNPHGGCIDPCVRIKVRTAEKRKNSRLVYLDVEKHALSYDKKRCVLSVGKNNVKET